MPKINKLSLAFVAATLTVPFFSSTAFAGERDYVKFVTEGVPENAPYNTAEVITHGYGTVNGVETLRCNAYDVFDKSATEKEACAWGSQPTPVPSEFTVSVRYGYNQPPGWPYTVYNPELKKPCKITIEFHGSLPPTIPSICQ